MALEQVTSDRWITPHNLELVRTLDNWAKERGHNVLELAFAWLLAEPIVASVIAGASSPEQVKQNVTAVEWELTSDDYAEVTAILDENPAENPAEVEFSLKILLDILLLNALPLDILLLSEGGTATNIRGTMTILGAWFAFVVVIVFVVVILVFILIDNIVFILIFVVVQLLSENVQQRPPLVVNAEISFKHTAKTHVVSIPVEESE